jgi:asparagine synthase (glutamine-hydrolysing)
VISTRPGALGPFSATIGGETVWGPSVAELTTRTRRPWTWDPAGVADLLVHSHPLGDRTVVADVRRADPEPLAGTRPPGPASATAREQADAAVEALVASVRAIEPDATLSLSGGLDSRVILAALLELGRRPLLRVSGVPGSFDRRVAEQIAAATGLELRPIEVTVDAVVAAASPAAVATAGVLPLTNVAGLLHLVTPEARTEPVILGGNGEFARDHYGPRRGFAAAAGRARPRRAALAHLERAMPVPVRPDETSGLGPELREAIDPVAVRARRQAVVAELPGDRAGDVADAFFLTQYTRHKTGADMDLLGADRARLPFADRGWVDQVRRLPSAWKLGSRWHRHALARLAPRLLALPEQGYGNRTARRPPRRYWLRGPAPGRGPHYLDQRMFRSDALLDLLRERRQLVADLVEPPLVDHWIDEQRAAGTRPHLPFALLSLALLREALGG